jgi:hypothetical protein
MWALILVLAGTSGRSAWGQAEAGGGPESDEPARAAPAAAGLSEEELKELEGAVEQKVQVGPEVFDEGLKYFYEKKYASACRRLWDYMAGNEKGAEKYGYAEFFLAQAFERLGLTHAAVEYYYNVAKDRTKPELLPDALQALERISRRVPFDQDLVLKDLLYDTNFGFVRPDLRDFILYHQGLLDYRNGFIRWGRSHFSMIKKGGYYYYKALYAEAVYELVKFNLDKALEMFREILASGIRQTDVMNSARQSVARILFEQKKYAEAYAMYEQIDAPIEKQASVFLEEAWAQYYLRNYQRAMGLLYALEAPSFYRFFSPEKHILKALIYKNLCHYNVAKDAIAEFFQAYGEAVRAVYDRVDLDKNPILLDAALQEPVLLELGRFQSKLDTELASLDRFESAWSPNGLMAHLQRIYGLKIQEANRQLQVGLQDSLRRVAEQLLEYEEQMNLLEYEIGLSIYKRLKGAPTQKDARKDAIPFYGLQVYYEFDGEFWNDEMHDFRFFIEDRCFSEERWE